MYKIALAALTITLCSCGSTDNPFATNESNPSLCETATSVVEGEFTVGSASDVSDFSFGLL